MSIFFWSGGTPRKKREKKVEEGGEQEETGEKKTEDEKTESETNGTDAAANEDKEEEEKKEENGEEESSMAPGERNATPAPIIENAEEVRQICEVDDCKAPIIDNSSSESEEEEGGAVKVRLNQNVHLVTQSFDEQKKCLAHIQVHFKCHYLLLDQSLNNKYLK